VGLPLIILSQVEILVDGPFKVVVGQEPGVKLFGEPGFDEQVPVGIVEAAEHHHPGGAAGQPHHDGVVDRGKHGNVGVIEIGSDGLIGAAKFLATLAT
jgi:hypothetical protein